MKWALKGKRYRPSSAILRRQQSEMDDAAEQLDSEKRIFNQVFSTHTVASMVGLVWCVTVSLTRSLLFHSLSFSWLLAEYNKYFLLSVIFITSPPDCSAGMKRLDGIESLSIQRFDSLGKFLIKLKTL